MNEILASLLAVCSLQFAYAQTNDSPIAVSLPDTVVMSTLPADIQLDASNSTDPDGEIEGYFWLIGQDTVAEGSQVSIQMINKTTTIKLVVVDDLGASDMSSFKIYVGHPTNNGLNRIPFRKGTLPLFASGMNIAWHRYARDLESYDEDAQAYFGELMDSISMNGGNTLRWWIHTNGAHSPHVDTSGFVTGLAPHHIQNMKQVLDLAFDHGLTISMCLWSFDMLQGNQEQNVGAMKKLLESPENIQSYIDNALTPILKKLGDHPAVLTWEIFNEPEGMTGQFGWTTGDRVGMFEVQRFVNLCAGAIHRECPSALVSNGSWSFTASTNVGNGNKNYYSDAALVEAGGDPEGVLDFYQIHYYPEHFGNDKSPFHRPADYWELDKPILIGEFPADTIHGRAQPHLSVEQAYQRAVQYGYAGAMSWSWSSAGDFNEDFSSHTAQGLKQVAKLIPNALAVNNDVFQINRIPFVTQPIPTYRMLLPDVKDSSFIDLSDVFFDDQMSTLQYSITSNSNSSVVNAKLNGGVLGYVFDSPTLGSSVVSVEAKDSAGWYSETEGLVMVGDPALRAKNLAYFHQSEASTTNNRRLAVFANDGDRSTFWQSANADDQWLLMHFNEMITFNFLAINWRGLSAVEYVLEVSDDGESWNEIYATESATGRKAAITLENDVEAQYLKLSMTRTNESDYAIEELTVQRILDNQSPEIIGEVKDYVITAGDVVAKNNYMRFENVFTDAEHPEYLRYEVQSSNEDLVKARISTGNVGVNLSLSTKRGGASTITIKAIDPFGAVASLDFDVIILPPLAVDESNKQIIVFPNPTSQRLRVISGEHTDILGVRLIDVRGMEHYHNEEKGLFFELDLEPLSKGIYILLITTPEGIKRYRVIRE